MSDPSITWSSAPNGLTFVLYASEVMGSSASQPNQNRSANRARMSSASVISHAAHSSRFSGRSGSRWVNTVLTGGASGA